MLSLPIDSHIEQIVEHVRRSRAAVVTAAPGAGKTTRVPPALMADGPVILLQPRRVAARAIARRIADERGWTPGREVGWQVRFERRFSAQTRLLVVTEGVLTARLQTDPLLSGFTTIVLDEFHERSVHADLAIALGRQAWRARADLRIVVMSATLEVATVSAFLDGCPVIDVPGRTHPLDIAHAPDRSVAEAAADVLAATDGQVLCFLPGAPEIRHSMTEIQQKVGDAVEVVPLHGSLDADAQDLALGHSSRRRVIVATNIAETSLTVPGVTAVVDAGLHKVARYDADRGIDSLETERITADAADQRAGRAGRLAPGIVRRLWDARDRLRPHREPEIHRVDLSGAVLDVIAWGGNPRTLEWFEAPREDAIDAALMLLERLSLVTRVRNPQSAIHSDTVRLTALGEQVRHLPLHPRLARMLIAGGGARQIAQACALLAERHLLPARAASSTSSDLLSAIDNWSAMPAHVKRVAEAIADFRWQAGDSPSPLQSATSHQPSATSSETVFRRAVLAGYPDRVAQRREPGSPSVRLASGSGATITPESGVRDGEFMVALDVRMSASRFEGAARRFHPSVREPARHVVRRRGPAEQASDAGIRMASRVEREWLQPTSSEVVHLFDKAHGRVRAAVVDRYDALVLAERPAPVDSAIASRLLADAWLERGPREDDDRLLRRLRFAGTDIDAASLASLVRAASYGARSLDEVEIAMALPAEVARALQRHAPETLAVPSGRHVRLDYEEDGSVSASVKLQELFGLAETPRLGPRRERVVFALLAPNNRPVQRTRDLRSFWDRTYPSVRKELRGRYPKHPWPEDPWTAPPTARTRRRQG